MAQVTFAANTFPARASTGNLVAKTLSDFALTLLDDADATAARVTLGVGTGTSGDMAGPTVSVDGEIPVFNGITGKVLKQSAGTDFSFDGHTLRVGSGGGLSAAVLTTLNAGVSLVLDDQGASGVGIWLKGNGATTPNKYIATTGGVFRILNDAASVEILRLTDAGAVTFPGTVTSNGGMVLTLAGNLSTTGAFNTSFTQRGSFTHTLPGATSVIPGIQSSVVIIKQPTPTSKAANSTLTAAEVLVGGAQYTGNTGTLTTPTGTLLDAAVTMSADEAFDFFVVNTGSGTCTLTMAASGMTAVGTMTVASNTSQNFRFRKTAGNAFTVYRA